KDWDYLLRKRYSLSKVLANKKIIIINILKLKGNNTVKVRREAFILIITSIIFTSLYIIFPNKFEFIKYSIFIIVLMIIAIIDYDTQYVYTITTYFGMTLGIIFSILEYYFFKNSLINMVCAALLAFLIIGLISYTTKAMGAGDIEIAVFVAIFLGVKKTLNFIAISFIIASIIAIVLILLKKKTRKDYISFGPSLAISAYLILVLSNIKI
ncbi:MAG: prepilin peptidase, partial [Sarcina sp.]